jgi:large subunit ribosomal protein L24
VVAVVKAQRRKLHVKKGDTVEIISGKDKSKRGKVLAAFPKQGKVIVEGINLLTKHQNPGVPDNRVASYTRKDQFMPPRLCLYATSAISVPGLAARILDDGTKVRVCKVCNEVIGE